MATTIEPIKRFWRFVRPAADSDCWIWTGGKVRGYGYFALSHRKSVRAHKFLWELANGPVQEGMHLHHVCENKACVNFTHLQVKTARENTLLDSDNLATINALKIRCHRGHEFTPENTYTYKGMRHCRKCNMINWYKWHNNKRL